MPELQQDTKKGNIMNEEQNDMSLLKTIYNTRLEPHNCFLKWLTTGAKK